MKSLKIYQTREGKAPFEVWLNKLKDKIGLAHINNRIRRLSLGQYGDCKRVGSGVFELRIHYGPGYRVYFAEKGSSIIILLQAGDKSSQKRDIQQAIAFWQDFKEQYRE